MCRSALYVCIAVSSWLLATAAWAAPHESVLHAFNPNPGPAQPHAGLIADSAGNRYGTTVAGGTYNAGTVFELKPKVGGGWTQELLYSFRMDGTDGTSPMGGLVMDPAGNLYGTTYAGGAQDCGTVFELTPSGGGHWTEQLLYTFSGPDGEAPLAGLIMDAAGNLYGTTYFGGPQIGGTVFELTSNGSGAWTEQVLYGFCDKYYCDYSPTAGVIMDAAGNLYGKLFYGSVFELTPNGHGGWTWSRCCTRLEGTLRVAWLWMPPEISMAQTTMALLAVARYSS